MQVPEQGQRIHGPNRSKWVLIGFLAVAAYFLWTEHQAHIMGALPYLLLLACPLMHLFHHHGHGGHHANHRHSSELDQRQSSKHEGDAS